MSKIKIKTEKKDLSLSTLFGTGNAEMNIIVPKYLEIKRVSKHLINVLCKLSEFKTLVADFPETKKGMQEISLWCKNTREKLLLDKKETEDELYLIDKIEFNKTYKDLKNNDVIKAIILHCNELRIHEKNIKDPKALNGDFIMQEPGSSYKIWPFSTFDIKKLWNHDAIKPAVKTFVLSVLSGYYNDSRELFELTTSPDIDIDALAEQLINSVANIQNTPAGSRCQRAFDKINNSISLFKANFKKYYRDAIVTKNPTIIPINFVTDVSKQDQSDFDIKLAGEFKVIVAQIYKASTENGKNKDPRIAKLFEFLSQNMDLMENSSRLNSEETKQFLEKSLKIFETIDDTKSD